MKVKKAVIPAAGKGTRFLPATKAIAKEMLPIVDRPMIQYVVEEAVLSGVKTIVLITSRGKSEIKDHFDLAPELESLLQKKGDQKAYREVHALAEMCEIISVCQQEQKGLGHAVLCARQAVGDEPFAVLLGDDIMDADPPVTAQMIQAFEEFGGSIIGVQNVPRDKIHLYGAIKGKEVKPRVHRIESIIEKPSPEEAPSTLASTGRYLFTPRIFELLADQPPGRGGEIQLTDAIDRLVRIESVYALEYQGLRFDAGEKIGYLRANLHYALKRSDLAAGVKEIIREFAKKI